MNHCSWRFAMCLCATIAATTAGATTGGKMGTKLLITTEGRSGSTFLGQLMNLHSNVFYLYEPCRSLPLFKTMKQGDKITYSMMTTCTKLVRALFDCAFTATEMSTLLGDKVAVSKSRVLRHLVANASLGWGSKASSDALMMARHTALLEHCRKSIKVVKEIRFTRGVPDNLLYSEIKVLHLVRDPRAVLHSRLQLEAFCGNTPRACVQPLCQGYRATLRSITSYLSTLEGRPFWQFYKFKRVIFEELASKPLEWTAKVYAWAGLGEPAKHVLDWVTKNTQEGTRDDGSYSTKRDSRKVIAKWRGSGNGDGGLSATQLRAVLRECGDILYQLNYSTPKELLPPWQTTPGSAVGGRVVPVEQDISIMSAYPRELIYQHWNAWCGKLSSIVPGYSGRGGHNDECQMLGTMPIRDCQRALEASTACSALSHHSGKCFLHDRTAADYLSFEQTHSKHAVKMLSGVDQCLIYDAPLHHARRFYYGEQLGMTVPDRRRFYIYGTSGDAAMGAHNPWPEFVSNRDTLLGTASATAAAATVVAAGRKRAMRAEGAAARVDDTPEEVWDMGAAWNYSALVKCYMDEYGIEPWNDERRHEMAQNTASLWLHEDLKRHPLRTLDPDEADLFVMPIETYVSAALTKPCTMRALVQKEDKFTLQEIETTQSMRNVAIVSALQASPYWRRHGGRDHMVVCAWWGAAKSWGKWKAGSTLWKMLRPSAILGTIDEYFARDWNKVLVVPYVAHALLTRWRKEPLPPFRTTVTSSANENAKKWQKHRRRFLTAITSTNTVGAISMQAEDKRASSSSNASGVTSSSVSLSTFRSTSVIPSINKKNSITSNTASVTADIVVQTNPRALLGSSVPYANMPTATELELSEGFIRRNVTFFFRGGILHGVDCKRKGTWVRRAAFEAFSEIPGARITATENLEKFSDEATGLIDPSITERQRRQARMPNYNAHQYVRELRESQYCLHLRGDTSTSRRIYDALAAGCVPVIISDDSHLPFKSQIDWDAFTVSINEDELIEHKARVPQALIETPQLLRDKQMAMRRAQEDLLYGYGSPYDPAKSRKFKSKVASHLLQEAFELVPATGKYRRFPDTFSACTLVQTLWPE